MMIYFRIIQEDGEVEVFSISEETINQYRILKRYETILSKLLKINKLYLSIGNRSYDIPWDGFNFEEMKYCQLFTK